MGVPKEVIVVSGVRKVIDAYEGILKDFHLVDLAASIVAEVINRAAVDAFKIGPVVIGKVIHTNPQLMHLPSYTVVKGGISNRIPPYTLYRLCSGIQAFI